MDVRDSVNAPPQGFAKRESAADPPLLEAVGINLAHRWLKPKHFRDDGATRYPQRYPQTYGLVGMAQLVTNCARFLSSRFRSRAAHRLLQRSVLWFPRMVMVPQVRHVKSVPLVERSWSNMAAH